MAQFSLTIKQKDFMESVNTTNRNKYALVTGATSGIGFELARLLAKDGYSLFVVARSADRLQAVADEFKQQFSVEVTPLPKDLFRPEAAKEIYDEIKSRGVEINVLVNDAGQGEMGKLFVDYDLERDVDMIQLNITSVVSLTKFFLKDMISRNEGKILQLASLVSKYPSPLQAVYAASKAFVLSFTEALINEVNDTNVTITALMPGATDTDFFHKADATDTVTYREMELSNPADVAADGYKALMAGERKIVSGFKNKMMAAMTNVMPDSMLAENMRKLNKTSEKTDGRVNSTHAASQEERATINNTTRKTKGDYDKHEDHVLDQH
jgi:uncharacterized protein